MIWTIVWSIYYLAYARRKFTHGKQWRQQEDAVAAGTAPETESKPTNPLPEPPG